MELVFEICILSLAPVQLLKGEAYNSGGGGVGITVNNVSPFFTLASVLVWAVNYIITCLSLFALRSRH